jgi:hypothetical protein
MGNSLRSIGAIAIGIGAGMLGPGAFSMTQFAIATFLFRAIFPPKQENGGLERQKNEPTKGAEVGTAIWEIFGKYERTGGELIRCGIDQDGVRSGIFQTTETESAGGKGVGGGQETEVTKQFLQATFAFCQGPTYIDKITEVNGTEGEEVIYDRYGTTDKARGVEVTPVYSAITGDLIAELSDKLRLYYGYEDQPLDSAEQEWYEEGTSADRGITKIVFNRYGPLEISTSFRVLLRNDRTNRRDIITARLARSGVPESRIHLRSIDEDATDVGWFVDSRQPARDLAEMVAAKSFHDLHFMPVEDEDGSLAAAAFTDISRVNPTYFTLSDEECGAYANADGQGQVASSANINKESHESGPREFEVKYYVEGKNFNNGGAVAQWLQSDGEPQSVNLPHVSNEQEMQDLAEISIAELHAAKGATETSLMPDRCQVAPGCVLLKPEVSRRGHTEFNYLSVRAQDVEPSGALSCRTIPYDPAVYGRHKIVTISDNPPPVVSTYSDVLVGYIDSVALTDAMAERATMLFYGWATRGESYSGIRLTSDFSSFDPFNLPIETVVGTTETEYTFEDADLYGYENVATIRVQLESNGTLVSSDEVRVGKKANVGYLETADGGIYFSYVTATPVVGQVGAYDLTGIIPGRKGSDYVREIPEGSKFVKITDENGNFSPGLKRVTVPLPKIRVATTYDAYAIMGNNEPVLDIETNFAARTLIPLQVSPTVSIEDNGAGGYILRAHARTRYAESEESYWVSGIPVRWSDPLAFRIRLKDGSTVVNTRVVTASDDGEIEDNYSAANLTSYFGSVPSSLVGEIEQIGTYGTGFVREFNVSP